MGALREPTMRFALYASQQKLPTTLEQTPYMYWRLKKLIPIMKAQLGTLPM